MPNTAAVVRSAWKIIPQFQSRSIGSSVKFYTESLGFALGGTHPDDGSSRPTLGSGFAGRKVDANIYLHECKLDDFHMSSAMVARGTAVLDGFYQLLKARPIVKITEDVGDKPWGYRQFSIEDCDGNKLTFFTFLEGGNPGGP